MGDTLRSLTVSTRLREIAEAAKRYPERVFNNVSHLIDYEFLKEAYHQTRKDTASGVDGVTAKAYAETLEPNLRNLHDRLRSNRYVAPPVERVWIEKDGGKQRPIGKPCFEDKIVQRAVVMILDAIYGHDFYDFSHGFRAGHSQHQALQELRDQCIKLNINWILDADVSGFFDNLNHGYLQEFIKQRVNDGGIKRLIGKWLNAGVLEGEILRYPEKGTQQGGVISPMLANIFLHHVLDDWIVKDVQPYMKGRFFLIRFADDFVIGFELEKDARMVMRVLSKRFNRFRLQINQDKTKLVRFGRLSTRTAEGSETFDFLGFTHYWGKSRKGYWIIKRKTIGKRLCRFIKSIWQWCRENRHEPLREQFKTLCAKLRGYYQYYGIRCNYKALERVYEETRYAWRYWLNRRSHKGQVNWKKFVNSIIGKFLIPRPRIIYNDV